MISIIRLQSQERSEIICDLVTAQLDKLQETVKDKGQLLYLTKRAKHGDVSLFIHTIDPSVLGDFIAEGLSQIEHVTGVWAIHMIKPIFYPLPRDTKNMKRFSVSLKVFIKNLQAVYKNIATATLPHGLKLAYLAYTFHLFEDSIQFSILTENEPPLNDFLTNVLEKMPGVLKTTVNLIERTQPLISYDAWRKYASKHGLVPAWDEHSMIEQFQT